MQPRLGIIYSFYNTIQPTIQTSINGFLKANWQCTYYKALVVFPCVLCSGRNKVCKSHYKVVSWWPSHEAVMCSVYPQDMFKIKSIILWPQAHHHLGSFNLAQSQLQLDKAEMQEWCWMLLIPLLVASVSPVRSTELITPLTSFLPQPLSSWEPSSLPLDFWIASFLSTVQSLLLLLPPLSIPLLLSPEIFSKEAEVIMSLPCSEFLTCL